MLWEVNCDELVSCRRAGRTRGATGPLNNFVGGPMAGLLVPQNFVIKAISKVQHYSFPFLFARFKNVYSNSNFVQGDKESKISP